MKYSGHADLPLHYGHIPSWLAQRMGKLGLAITEVIISEFGTGELLRKLSDPFWFQSIGAVMGMDWHSSGITTSVMGALKRAVNPHAKELGVYICGGKGKASRETPRELLSLGDRTGLDGNELVQCSKLSAKVDNTAIQDGFQLYTHNFIVDRDGKWTVVQQGMSDKSSMARRYHWHSPAIASFVQEPHTAICGHNQGTILNMVSKQAARSQQVILSLANEAPERILAETRKLVLPSHHDVRHTDIDMKRLGAMLWLVNEKKPGDFSELLLLEGLGPRTLQSLALVSEVIYGAPSRFSDPARFSFAHGGKDGHPFPVPLKIYDETIGLLQQAVSKAKLDQTDKVRAIQKLSELSRRAEKGFVSNTRLDDLIEHERQNSWKFGGRTVFGEEKSPALAQLSLF